LHIWEKRKPARVRLQAEAWQVLLGAKVGCYWIICQIFYLKKQNKSAGNPFTTRTVSTRTRTISKIYFGWPSAIAHTLNLKYTAHQTRLCICSESPGIRPESLFFVVCVLVGDVSDDAVYARSV
jgi:hypothetical protein